MQLESVHPLLCMGAGGGLCVAALGLSLAPAARHSHSRALLCWLTFSVEVRLEEIRALLSLHEDERETLESRQQLHDLHAFVLLVHPFHALRDEVRRRAHATNSNLTPHNSERSIKSEKRIATGWLDCSLRAPVRLTKI